MNFSQALDAIKSGKRMSRKVWRNEPKFVFLVAGSQFQVNRPPLLGIYPEGTWISYQAHIDMRLPDGSIMVWTPSQSCLMADDWELYEGLV